MLVHISTDTLERAGVFDGLGSSCAVKWRSYSFSFPFLILNSHTMPRERGMPGMYANAVPLGTYGSPYTRPLLSGQQQIPKLLSSKWVLLSAFQCLKNITVLFWSVALLQIKSGFGHPSSLTLCCFSLLLFLYGITVVKCIKM